MKKIVIIEDKPEERQYAIAAAQEKGFEDIIVAETLSKGLAAIETHKPDYIATDLMFPLGNYSVKSARELLLPLYEKFESEQFTIPKFTCPSEDVVKYEIKKINETYGWIPSEEEIQERRLSLDERMNDPNLPEFVKSVIESNRKELQKHTENRRRRETDIANLYRDPMDILREEFEANAKKEGISLADYLVQESVRERQMYEANPSAYADSSATMLLTGKCQPFEYDNFVVLRQAMENGTNVPSGYIVATIAKEANIPVVVVTDTNHHALAAQPVIRELYKLGTYADGLTESHKDWKQGICKILKE